MQQQRQPDASQETQRANAVSRGRGVLRLLDPDVRDADLVSV